MSRIGKKAIEIPKDVLVILEKEKICIKGQYGILERSISDVLSITIEQNKLILIRKNNEKTSKAYHGLIRALIQNMVIGVTEKYSKTLIAEGVGYKFQIDKDVLVVNVGFTHSVKFIIPSDINIKLDSSIKIIISGIDKEKVGFLASKIRTIRPPEPYKGKGLLYDGEKIRRKAGKTGK
jgi:large subunit ribosomal protein L6